MRTHNLFSQLGTMLVAFVLLLVVAGESSYAAGTRAGTVITSNASATYTDQTGSGPTYNASATALNIYVAYKPVSTVTVNTGAQTGVDSSYVVYQLTVANTGNYGDAYAVELAPTDLSKMDSVGYYSNAGLTAALGGSAKNVLRDTIPADGNVNVWAKLYIKYDASFNSYNNATIVGTFRSRSTRDTLADSAITVGPNKIPIGNGLYHATFNASGTTTTTIVQSIYDITATPLRPSVRPGDTLSYVIKYNNTGAAADTGAKVFVTYPANMSYSSQSSANWVNNGTYAVYSVGNIAANSTQLSVTNPLILSVSNSASLVEGTPTSLGSFGIIYKQNATNGLTQTRVKTSTFSTANYAFKAFSTTRTAALADTAISAQAGDSITVKWIIKNNSNGSDAYTIKFVSASEGSWTEGYYWESGSDHVYTPGTDPRFNNPTYASAQYVTTPTIARNTDTTIYIRTKVPSGLSGATVHLILQISSARDSATVSGEAVGGTVTPLLPNLVVQRARVINPADSIGNGATVSVVPGGTVTYYIYVKNTGTGAASTVVITDNVSATGGYTNPPTSATINDGSDHTFAIPGGSAGTYGSIVTNGSGVVITINSLAAGASRIIHYATTVQ